MERTEKVAVDSSISMCSVPRHVGGWVISLCCVLGLDTNEQRGWFLVIYTKQGISFDLILDFRFLN